MTTFTDGDANDYNSPRNARGQDSKVSVSDAESGRIEEFKRQPF